MSSSSEEVPIEELAARVGKPVSVERSQSPVPDWLSQYQSPAAAGQTTQARSSSDSDILQILTSSKPGKDEVTTATTQSTQPEPTHSALALSSKPASHKKSKKSPKKPKQQASAVPTVATTLQRSGLQPAAQLATAAVSAEAPDGTKLRPGQSGKQSHAGAVAHKG